MLEKSIIPPQAGMPHDMNPAVGVHLQNGSIVIPTEAIQFQDISGKPRRILINNFDAAASFTPFCTLRAYANPRISRAAIHAYFSKSTRETRLDI